MSLPLFRWFVPGLATLALAVNVPPRLRAQDDTAATPPAVTADSPFADQLAAAKNDNGEAMAWVAAAYETGHGVKADLARAAYWWNRASATDKVEQLVTAHPGLPEQVESLAEGPVGEAIAKARAGDVESQIWVAEVSAGTGGDLLAWYPYPRAEYWYRRAEASGSTAALVAHAIFLENLEDSARTAEMVALLEKAIAAGDPGAYEPLSRYYFFRAVPPEETKAAAIARAGAEKGVLSAQRQLVYFFKQNPAVVPAAEALKWARAAAGQERLAIKEYVELLLDPAVGGHDVITAHEWLERAQKARVYGADNDLRAITAEYDAAIAARDAAAQAAAQAAATPQQRLERAREEGIAYLAKAVTPADRALAVRSLAVDYDKLYADAGLSSQDATRQVLTILIPVLQAHLDEAGDLFDHAYYNYVDWNLAMQLLPYDVKRRVDDYFTAKQQDYYRRQFIAETLPKAQAGDPDAQLKAGYQYLLDEKLKDESLALEWFAKAATAGNAKAREEGTELAHKLLAAFKIDSPAALDQLKTLADHAGAVGLLDGWSQVLHELYAAGDIDTVPEFESLKALCEHALAQAATAHTADGDISDFRLIVSHDFNDLGAAAAKAGHYDAGVFAFHYAADFGDAEALANLGLCYYNGWGVAADATQAFGFWQRAANLGHVNAMANLGFCYLDGDGTPQPDREKAVFWLKKAADAGHAEAKSTLAELATRDQLDASVAAAEDAQDYDRALALLTAAADAGNADAMSHLGDRLRLGYGALPPDKPAAFKWYKAAADAGSTTAPFWVEFLSRDVADHPGSPAAGSANPKEKLAKNTPWSLDDVAAALAAGKDEGSLVAALRHDKMADFGTLDRAAFRTGPQKEAARSLKLLASTLDRFQQNGTTAASRQLADAAIARRRTALGNPAPLAWKELPLPADDPAARLALLLKSARAGDPYAQFRLGLEFANAMSPTAQNVLEAERWFIEAGAHLEGDPRTAVAARLACLYDLLTPSQNGGGSQDFLKYDPAYRWARELMRRGGALAEHARIYFSDTTAPNPPDNLIKSALALPPEVPPFDDATRAALEKSAASGDVPAMLKLADALATGRGLPQDDIAAVGYLRSAAAKGDIAAMKRLAVHYQMGFGVNQDPAQVAAWYEKAAAAGDISAWTQLGYFYEVPDPRVNRPADHAKALAAFQKAADAGDAAALGHLGLMYRYGQGVVADAARSADYYQRAADAGNTLAMREVAANLSKAGDHRAALDWYRRSYDKDHDGYSRVAIARELSSLGQDAEAIAAWRTIVDESPDYAEYRYFLAAALEHAGQFEEARQHYTRLLDSDNFIYKGYARDSLARVAKSTARGGDFDLRQRSDSGDLQAKVDLAKKLAATDREKARELVHAASDAGHPEGMMLWAGELFATDKPAAIALIKKSAAAGWPEAQARLGAAMMQGQLGDPADVPGGIQLVLTAARNGYGPAQFEIGRLYFTGAPGLEANATLGLRFLQMAADQKIAAAEALLGQAYETGAGGVPIDKTAALDHYRKAAAGGITQVQPRIDVLEKDRAGSN